MLELKEGQSGVTQPEFLILLGKVYINCKVCLQYEYYVLKYKVLVPTYDERICKQISLCMVAIKGIAKVGNKQTSMNRLTIYSRGTREKCKRGRALPMEY